MKQSITKILAAVMAVVMIAGVFAACSGEGGQNKKVKIGVIQMATHEALDAAYEGFQKKMQEAGYTDDTLQYVYHNAENEQSNCLTIAEQLKNDNCDLILAIGTPAAQAVANAIKDVPILVTAVTDPAKSGLVATNEAPGGNVSGTSDLNPVEKQMDLIQEIVPNAKTVGLLYCSNEDNSKVQIDLAKEILTGRNIATEEMSITQMNEVQSVVEAVNGKVDAIYVPTDNVLASCMDTASQAAVKIGVPLIVGESALVAKGGLATCGLSYYNLGIRTGDMALQILKDGKTVGDMPIQYLPEEDLEYAVNTDTAAALNVTLPASLQGEGIIRYPAAD